MKGTLVLPLAMQTRTIGLLSLAALAAGCGAPPEPGAEPKQQLEETVNVYARALQDRDHRALEGLLSREVRERLGRYEGGMNRFVEKQRAVMLKTFTMMDAVRMADRFLVSAVDPQGDTAAVSLSYAGQEIPRPFYFVREDGRWALNLAAPGFSRALPEGALPMNTYRVTTGPLSGGGPFRDIGCIQSNHTFFWRTVAGTNTSYPIGCQNVCGFFTGSQFNLSAAPTSRWEGSQFCDYNTWGTDVWVNGVSASCNDPC